MPTALQPRGGASAFVYLSELFNSPRHGAIPLLSFGRLRSRSTMSSAAQEIGGPFFEDLHLGQIFDSAPAVTLTEGFAAVHASILGDRMRLPLDPNLSRPVLGAQLAHPAFAWDIAIGQATLVTHRVIANLFYRGCMFHRAPCIGDILNSTTE